MRQLREVYFAFPLDEGSVRPLVKQLLLIYMVTFASLKKLVEILFQLICCERKMLFQLKK